MESVVPATETGSLLPAAVKSFLELRDEPYLPQSNGKYVYMYYTLDTHSH